MAGKNCSTPLPLHDKRVIILRAADEHTGAPAGWSSCSTCCQGYAVRSHRQWPKNDVVTTAENRQRMTCCQLQTRHRCHSPIHWCPRVRRPELKNTYNYNVGQCPMWWPPRPAKYSYRPLFNAAKSGWCPLLKCRAVMKPRHETRWNLLGCPKQPNQSQPLVRRSSPYCEDTWERYCCLTRFYRLFIRALFAKI